MKAVWTLLTHAEGQMRGFTLLAREMARLGEVAGAETSVQLVPAYLNSGGKYVHPAASGNHLQGWQGDLLINDPL